jgi:hypothetical protein
MIDRPVHRLLYWSRQTPAVALGLDAAVGDILRASIANNSADRISGLLLCIQGVFLQVLEGPEEAVRHAYGRIGRDPRHREVSLIGAGRAEGRLFAEWSMCARSLNASDKAIVDLLDAKGEFEPRKLREPAALKLLTTVAAIQRRTATAA